MIVSFLEIPDNRTRVEKKMDDNIKYANHALWNIQKENY